MRNKILTRWLLVGYNKRTFYFNLNLENTGRHLVIGFALLFRIFANDSSLVRSSVHMNMCVCVCMQLSFVFGLARRQLMYVQN